MKRLLLAFVLSLPLIAQNVPCNFQGQVTQAGTSIQFDNRKTGCYQWRVAYTSTGFTVVSIQLEEAPDSGGAPGSWAAFTGATVVTDGSNPSTSTNAATIGVHSAAAWVRLNLATLTGSGQVNYQVWGANSVNTVQVLPGSGTVLSVTATSPVESSGGNNPNIDIAGVTAEQGNGAKLQLSTGNTTLNDCVKFDANGNTVDAGSPCGGGGSSQLVLISSQILSSPAASIIFSSIPGTYNNLQIVYNVRCSASATNENVNMQVNSDSGSNYSYQYMLGAGSVGANVGQGTSGTLGLAGQCIAATGLANVASSVVIDLPNYAGTSFYKGAYVRGQTFTNTTIANSITDYTSTWLWANTSAITQIVISPASGNFTTGSTFYLYGY